jgi:type II secretory ATPase GspE/PulE/Tfp pilus assembly ATPase PilB-like protein
MISGNESKDKILQEAVNSYGFKSILEIGMSKALKGITTIEEILRVTKS